MGAGRYQWMVDLLSACGVRSDAIEIKERDMEELVWRGV